MEVTPFLEGPARDLAEIKARVVRLRQEFRELERARKGDGTRRKRGLFDGSGQLLNWLFGTATTKDLESVHSRLESFDKKGLEVVHLLQDQATLLNMTMGQLAEHESEISALMAAAGQMRREQAQLRKAFNDSWTHLARELLFLQKIYNVFPMLVATAKRSRYPILNVTSVIDEKAAEMLSKPMAPVVEQSQPVTKSPIIEEAPAAIRTPTCLDLAGTSLHLRAVERLRRQWEEEGNAKSYPFEWLIGCLFPLPLLVYLWIEYRRLSSHVDTLLLANFVEVRESGKEDQGQPGPNASRVNIVV
ncbi:Uncharacterized protein APZ42_000865 [Daphnia magna]|uniref:Uncharacterized protein n=1 Tax=Daphnia magna TaxID=35525 RepID=A0A164JBT4_9CRUS|nr:Uncharacterized protein APZ42_000865 [Daphnia magna]